MKARPLSAGPGPIALLEQAVHLLRTAPAAAWLNYHLGTLPFLLGLLYFWSDMSRGSFAVRRLPAAALGMVLLFVWMKTWHARFARHLRAQASGTSLPRMGWRNWARMAVRQAAIQPAGLFLLPPALFMLVPFPWVYGFFQSATALEGGEPGRTRDLIQRAWRQTFRWPAQQVWALGALKLCGFFALLNLLLAAVLGPMLLKSFFGVETVFSRAPLAVLNSTFFAAVFALAHLCLDPLAKALYALRCFHGEAISTGEDLRAELRSLRLSQVLLPVLLASLASLGSLACVAGVQAAETPTAKATPALSVETRQLNDSIEDVLRRAEYDWRLPRVREADEPSPFGAFLESVIEVLRDWLRALNRWIDEFLRWLRPSPAPSDSGGGFGWVSQLHWLLVALVALLACVLGVTLVCLWRQRSRDTDVAAMPVAAAPDITDENVGADELPEDGWLGMARELRERGELRLALRALYLGTLAHLAAKNLVTLAKFKSNRDYDRELRRRSHALPEVTAWFTENVSMFDRAWYGLHEVTAETWQQFLGNVERIKAGT